MNGLHLVDITHRQHSVESKYSQRWNKTPRSIIINYFFFQVAHTRFRYFLHRCVNSGSQWVTHSRAHRSPGWPLRDTLATLERSPSRGGIHNLWGHKFDATYVNGSYSTTSMQWDLLQMLDPGSITTTAASVFRIEGREKLYRLLLRRDFFHSFWSAFQVLIAWAACCCTVE